MSCRFAFHHLVSVTPLLLLTGCGGGSDAPPLVPVSGKVTVDGSAVRGATVTFLPQQSGLNTSIGTTRDGGTFELFYSSSRGAVPGEYKVTVSYFANPDGTPFQQSDDGLDIEQMQMQGKVKQALPPKYHRPSTDGTQLHRPGRRNRRGQFRSEHEVARRRWAHVDGEGRCRHRLALSP